LILPLPILLKVARLSPLLVKCALLILTLLVPLTLLRATQRLLLSLPLQLELPLLVGGTAISFSLSRLLIIYTPLLILALLLPLTLLRLPLLILSLSLLLIGDATLLILALLLPLTLLGLPLLILSLSLLLLVSASLFLGLLLLIIILPRLTLRLGRRRLILAPVSLSLLPVPASLGGHEGARAKYCDGGEDERHRKPIRMTGFHNTSLKSLPGASNCAIINRKCHSTNSNRGIDPVQMVALTRYGHGIDLFGQSEGF